MKTFIKDNWFKVGLLVIFLMCAVYYFLIFLPPQYQQQNLAKQQADYVDLQAKCATQAQKVLDNADATLGSGFSQQNHYNQKMGKCFVLIDYVPRPLGLGKPEDEATDNESLLDAYENNTLANCIYFGNKLTSITSDPVPSSCLIGNYATTSKAYNNFVVQRMELDQ